MRELDCRGQACPRPVVEAGKALSEQKPSEQLAVLVDSEIAAENLIKMAAQKQIKAVLNHDAAMLWRVVMTAPISGESFDDSSKTDLKNLARQTPSQTVIAVGSNQMGEGDADLGQLLIKGYFYALTSAQLKPQTLVFYNSGAKLTVSGSESLQDLMTLQEQGVRILTCGTCLNHFGLTDKLAVGESTNLYTIAELLNQADKVIKP